MEIRYNPQDQPTDVRKLYAAINSTPQDKRTIIKVLAETFARGMDTQAALTGSSRTTGA